MISCQQATKLMSLSMERKLTLKETIDLKLHLMICSLCLQFQEQVRNMSKLLRAYHPIGEKHLSKSVKDQMKQRLKNI